MIIITVIIENGYQQLSTEGIKRFKGEKENEK